MANEPYKMTVTHQGYFTPDMLARCLGIKPSEAIAELRSRGAKDLLNGGTIHQKSQQVSREVFGKVLADRGFDHKFVQDRGMEID